MCIQRQYHVHIRRKILQRIPLIVELDGRGHAFEPGEFRIVHDEVGVLQARRAAVNDELAAKHFQIGILLVAMGDVAVGEIFRVGLRMKRVACRVNAHESHAFVDGFQQLLLALG